MWTLARGQLSRESSGQNWLSVSRSQSLKIHLENKKMWVKLWDKEVTKQKQNKTCSSRPRIRKCCTQKHDGTIRPHHTAEAPGVLLFFLVSSPRQHDSHCLTQCSALFYQPTLSNCELMEAHFNVSLPVLRPQIVSRPRGSDG